MKIRDLSKSSEDSSNEKNAYEYLNHKICLLFLPI